MISSQTRPAARSSKPQVKHIKLTCPLEQPFLIKQNEKKIKNNHTKNPLQKKKVNVPLKNKKRW